MKVKHRGTCILAFGFALAALGQQNSQPPAPLVDSGPTLAATMQFIQEKLSEKGKVGWAETFSNQPSVIYRLVVNVGDVMADPAACTLYTTESIVFIIDLPPGKTVKPGGPLTADDLHTQTVETDTVSFKQVEKIAVERAQDLENQRFAEAAHPEITATVTPPVFFVKLSASNAVFSVKTTVSRGSQAAVDKETTTKTNGIVFSDEDTANRVAKAMTHAMELCGGGAKKEIF